MSGSHEDTLYQGEISDHWIKMISQSEFHRQNNESRRQNYPESVNLEIYYFYSKKYKVCSRKTMNQGGGP